MTRRWGPVGWMRVGGMGLGQAMDLVPYSATGLVPGPRVGRSARSPVTPWPFGSGSGVNTAAGFVPVSTIGPAAVGASLSMPLPYAPPHPSVVNPSPITQLTTTGSSTTAPGSVVSQANGTVALPGATASTVGGQVSTNGGMSVGNWALIAGLAAFVFFAKGK